MSSAGEALKAYLVGSTAVNAVVSGRVHQNTIPQVSSRPNIWFMRSAEQDITAMDGDSGLRKASFDVECIATSADAAIDLGDLVKDRVRTTRKSTGYGVNMRALFVEDHSDEYAPKGIGSDDGLHVAALDMTIWYTT